MVWERAEQQFVEGKMDRNLHSGSASSPCTPQSEIVLCGWGRGQPCRLQISVPGRGAGLGAETAWRGQAVVTEGILGRSLGPWEGKEEGVGLPQELLSLRALSGKRTLPTGAQGVDASHCCHLGLQRPALNTSCRPDDRCKVPPLLTHWVMTAPVTSNSPSGTQNLPQLSWKDMDRSSH